MWKFDKSFWWLLSVVSFISISVFAEDAGGKAQEANPKPAVNSEANQPLGRPLPKLLPLGRPLPQWSNGKIVLREWKGELWPFFREEPTGAEARLGTDDTDTAKILRDCPEFSRCAVRSIKKTDADGEYLHVYKIDLNPKENPSPTAPAATVEEIPEKFFLIKVGANAQRLLREDKNHSKLCFVNGKVKMEYFPSMLFARETEGDAFSLNPAAVSDDGYAVFGFVPARYPMENSNVEVKTVTQSEYVIENGKDVKKSILHQERLYSDPHYSRGRLDPKSATVESLRKVVGSDADIIASGSKQEMLQELKKAH